MVIQSINQDIITAHGVMAGADGATIESITTTTTRTITTITTTIQATVTADTGMHITYTMYTQ